MSAERVNRAQPSRSLWPALVVAGAGIVLLPAALAAQGNGEVVGVVEAFRRAAAGWPTQFRPVANSLLAIFFCWEMLVTALYWRKKRVGMEAMIAEGIQKLWVIAAVLLFFNMGGPGLIVSSLRGLAPGQTDPGQLLAQGFRLAQILLSGLGQQMVAYGRVWMELADGLVRENIIEAGTFGLGNILAVFRALQLLTGVILVQVIFSLVVTGLGVVVAEVGFAFVALQMLFVEVETTLLVAFGVFFLSFASFRVTAAITEAYIKAVVVNGLRLFLVMPLAGLGNQLAATWASNIRNSVSVETLYVNVPTDGGPVRVFEFSYPALDIAAMVMVLVAICLYVYVVWAFPAKFARQFGDLKLNLSGAVKAD